RGRGPPSPARLAKSRARGRRGGTPPRRPRILRAGRRVAAAPAVPATPYCRGVTLVLLVRHGLTATTGGVLTGWTPGIPLDDRGRGQAAALAGRLAPVTLDAIVSSPL